MNVTALSAPVGNVPTAPIHTAPEFGVFVVSKSNGSGGGTGGGTGSGGGITITLNPLSASLQNGGTQQFSANVTGATNTGVIWSLQPQIGGISSTGLYTAPSSISGPTTVSVTATSVADPTKSAAATISLTPAASVSVTVTPSSASLQASQKQQFAAQVTGSTNTGVTWSLLSAVGSISSAGLYTAPATITSSTTVTVKATSVADPTKSATATITLTKAAALVISPTSATVKAKNSQQFTVQTPNVKVTWSISPQQIGYGAIHQTGLYWAPDHTTTTKTVIVKATDVSDPTRYATATVTVVP
jgi:hypothetical protein